MTLPPVVSNSSALIALDQIGQLPLLERLFSEVVVPPAVVREVSSIVVAPSWVIERALTQPVGAEVLQAQLGPGESEAISLAVELHARWVILDDRPARRLAEALGLPLIGTLGIVLVAKRRGFLREVRASLDELMKVGFRVAPELYRRVLIDAGEPP